MCWIMLSNCHEEFERPSTALITNNYDLLQRGCENLIGWLGLILSEACGLNYKNWSSPQIISANFDQILVMISNDDLNRGKGGTEHHI